MSRRVTGGNEPQLLKCSPPRPTSNLRSNSNPFRTVKCITSNPTKEEQNKEILCSYDIPNQTSRPVHSCCTIPIWQMTLDFCWILGFTSVKEPFSLFSWLFFLVSIVLTSLFRLFYVTCELNTFFYTEDEPNFVDCTRKNAFHQSRTERKDNRAAPEMSARHNSGANKGN